MLRLFIPIFLSFACGPSTSDIAAADPNQPIVSAEFSSQWAPSGKARVTPFARGKEAFMAKLWLAPNAAVPEHQDPDEEYLYILSGRGTLSLNGVQHEIGPGHVIFMPANATVSFKNGDEALEAIQVFANPESADKYAKWGDKPN